MSRRTNQIDEMLQDWLHANSLRKTEVQRELREAMVQHPEGEMQTSPEQVQFMGLMLKAMNAKCVVEVGVFTGYSALGMALSLPKDGKLIACDISEQYMAESRSWWQKAAIDHLIEERIGPGADTLRALIEEGYDGTVDFMYVDADKTGYPDYYELGFQLLRDGGIIAFDNMFRGGNVADLTVNDENTVATRALASKLLHDERIEYSLVPIGDGLGLGMKR